MPRHSELIEGNGKRIIHNISSLSILFLDEEELANKMKDDILFEDEIFNDLHLPLHHRESEKVSEHNFIDLTPRSEQKTATPVEHEAVTVEVNTEKKDLKEELLPQPKSPSMWTNLWYTIIHSKISFIHDSFVCFSLIVVWHESPSSLY